MARIIRNATAVVFLAVVLVAGGKAVFADEVWYHYCDTGNVVNLGCLEGDAIAGYACAFHLPINLYPPVYYDCSLMESSYSTSDPYFEEGGCGAAGPPVGWWNMSAGSACNETYEFIEELQEYVAVVYGNYGCPVSIVGSC